MPIDRIRRFTTLAALRLSPRRLGTNAPAIEFAYTDDAGLIARDANGVIRLVDSQPETNLPGGAFTLGTSGLLVAGGTLTNAQVKALRATPVTLVAAPGADLVIVPHRLILGLNYAGTNVFTESADNFDLRYVGVASPVLMTVENTGFIDQSADTITMGLVAHDKIVAAASCVNKGVELFNNGDGEIGGNAGNDNTVNWRLIYAIVSAGF